MLGGDGQQTLMKHHPRFNPHSLRGSGVIEELPVSGVGSLSIQSSINCVMVFSFHSAYSLSLFSLRSDMRICNPLAFMVSTQSLDFMLP